MPTKKPTKQSQKAKHAELTNVIGKAIKRCAGKYVGKKNSPAVRKKLGKELQHVVKKLGEDRFKKCANTVYVLKHNGEMGDDAKLNILTILDCGARLYVTDVEAVDKKIRKKCFTMNADEIVHGSVDPLLCKRCFEGSLKATARK